jgi:hypothetical protein
MKFLTIPRLVVVGLALVLECSCVETRTPKVEVLRSSPFTTALAPRASTPQTPNNGPTDQLSLWNMKR